LCFENVSTIGKFSAKSFHYWQQMADSGKAESGGARQVNKLLGDILRSLNKRQALW
jgi:hypothetical protein